jgi:uncharacterized protein
MATKHPFRISTLELTRYAGTRQHLDLEGPVDITAARDCAFDDAPVQVSVDLESFSDKIDVKAVIRCGWTGQCSRCTDDVSGTLEVVVDEVYAERPLDDSMFAMAHDHIDLEPMVNEMLVMELPDLPVMRPTDDGRCPWCDQDVSNTIGVPDERPIDPRWAGLSALNVDD